MVKIDHFMTDTGNNPGLLLDVVQTLEQHILGDALLYVPYVMHNLLNLLKCKKFEKQTVH